MNKTVYEIQQTTKIPTNTEKILEDMVMVEEMLLRESMEDHFLIAIKYGSVDEYIEIFREHLENFNFIYDGSLYEHRFQFMDEGFEKYVGDFEPKRLSHIFNLMRNYVVHNVHTMTKH